MNSFENDHQEEEKKSLTRYIDLLSQQLKKEKDHKEFLIVKGLLYSDLGDIHIAQERKQIAESYFEKAFFEFNEAITYHQTSPKPFFFRAGILLKLNSPEEAQKDFIRGMFREDEPNYFETDIQIEAENDLLTAKAFEFHPKYITLVQDRFRLLRDISLTKFYIEDLDSLNHP